MLETCRPEENLGGALICGHYYADTGISVLAWHVDCGCTWAFFFTYFVSGSSKLNLEIKLISLSAVIAKNWAINCTLAFLVASCCFQALASSTSWSNCSQGRENTGSLTAAKAVENISVPVLPKTSLLGLECSKVHWKLFCSLCHGFTTQC